MELYRICQGSPSRSREDLANATGKITFRTDQSDCMNCLFFGFAVPIRETRVAKSGADGQDTPALHVLHEGDFRKPLNGAVIMHDNRRVMVADLRDRLDKTCRQVEFTAFPITRQVLRPLLNRSVAVDHARARDADKRRELESLLVGLPDQILQHLYKPLYGSFPARLVIRVPPQL